MEFMNLFKLINIFYELRRGLRGHLTAYNSRSLVARGSLLVALLFAIPAFAAQSAYDLMERANALYRDGKFKQAITLYRKAESRGADPVATSFNARWYAATHSGYCLSLKYTLAMLKSAGEKAPFEKSIALR